MKTMPKVKIERSDKYLAYIRTLPCTICRSRSIAHHTQTGGMGIKGSDYLTIPLCGDHHLEVHQWGRRTFEEHYGIAQENIAKQLLQKWMIEKNKEINNEK